MEQIDPTEVAKKYNLIDKVWDTNDKWHVVTHNMIKNFIWNVVLELTGWRNFKILNAGSCGYSYDLNEDNIIHIDIAGDKLRNFKKSITASVEAIPLPNHSVDVVICVGSVLNYCDPIKALNEFARVLDRHGYLILEFENSYTLELLGTSSFNKKATLEETFYNGQKEKIWFYAESYIRELTRINGFELISMKRCHILSPLIYRLFKNERQAAKYANLDNICSMVPFLRKFSSNSIFLFKKSDVID
jgi:ubiquinone/menaquinone biosynthesis C-methylase UbiE